MAVLAARAKVWAMSVSLESLIAEWGYLAVTLGVLTEGEASLLAAGAMAHKGLLTLRWVCVAAFVGTVLGNQTWFWLGRRFGSGFIAKRPKLAAHSESVQRWVTRYGAVFVTAVRFLYGLRTASVLWLGASGYPFRRFVLFDTLGAALWAVIIGGAGWGLGASLHALLGRKAYAEELLLVAAAVALAVLIFVRSRKSVRPSAP
jgi:membrane protein DedA with SNARE-associated domain